MNIFIVEKCESSTGSDCIEAFFCFDTQHEAEAFISKVDKKNPKVSYYITEKHLFRHSSDAVKYVEA
jgi:hypothetical protein